MMKDRSKKMCGHGVSANQRSDVCQLRSVCGFLFYWYPCSKEENMVLQCPERGGSTLYEIYIGFCPRIDFHNNMHIDCLTYDYSICDIVFLLPVYMVKKMFSCITKREPSMFTKLSYLFQY